MKRNKKTLILLMIMSSFLTVNAAYLKYYTAGTYVKSDHPSEFYYKGEVSVRGTDRISCTTPSKFCYPIHSRITYRVPKLFGGYTDHVKQVNARNGNDFQRKDTIVVNDTLNPVAGKTQALWNIGLVDQTFVPTLLPNQGK